MTTVDEPVGLEPAASVRVRRTPLYFESRGAWLFGWIHQGEPSSARRRGVIICAPLGYEQIHAHRGLRHLADALAEAGFPVMRFDYHGTGDSAGADEDADRHSTWLANLRSAIGWMRGELGCAEISVVGIRLGATLAVQVAADESVADLVLWVPVVKGRAYVRELKFLSKTAGVPVAGSKDIETAGFVVAERTAHDLAAIDLMQIRPRCRRALLVDRDDLPADAQLLDHLRGLGIEARRTVQPGYAKMMAEPHHTKVPHQAIAEIVSWLCGGEAGTRAELPPERVWPAEALVTSTCGGLLRERALCLCPQPNLFGILSEPVAQTTATSELPAVVLLNAGSSYHVGPNRLHVLLARRLAAAGFRCLRMDLHGLGDSVTPHSERENEPYPATAFRDIDLAMKYLEREIGAGRTVLMGLCSGAFFAFQSAAQLTDPGLVESILINLETVFWQEGMSAESLQSSKFKATQHGHSSALNGGTLRGNSDRWESRHLADQQPQRVCNDSGPAAFPSHPPTNDLSGVLSRAAGAKRLLTFFFARSDPGYDILTFFAERLIEEMCGSGQMRIGFIENADHTFARRAPREVLLDAIVADLSDRYRNTAASELRRHRSGRLPDDLVPSAYQMLDTFSLTANGKLDRKALPAPAMDNVAVVREYLPPRNPVEEVLVGIWREVLSVERIGIHDDFFELGGNSLLALQLFARVEKQFDKRLPQALLFQHSTVAGIARHLTSRADEVCLVEVLELQRGQADRPRLFAMPTIGGELMAVHRLIGYLGSATPIFGLQPNLSVDVVDQFVEFESTATQYVEALRQFQPSGPYALIGYSYGGMLAYEVARQLTEQGMVVDLLAILDTVPVQCGRVPTPAELPRILRNVARWLLDDASYSPRDLYGRLRRTVKRVTPQWMIRLLGKRLTPQPRAVELGAEFHNPLLLTLNHELVAAHKTAFLRYIPKPYPGTLTLFRSRTQPLFSGLSKDLGWSRFASRVEIHEIPGHHLTILDEPHVGGAARAIQRCLDWLEQHRAARFTQKPGLSR